MQYSTGISRNTQSKFDILSLTEYVNINDKVLTISYTNLIGILSTHIHGLSAVDDRNTLLDNLLVIEVAYSSYLLLSGQANMSTVNRSMS